MFNLSGNNCCTETCTRGTAHWACPLHHPSHLFLVHVEEVKRVETLAPELANVYHREKNRNFQKLAAYASLREEIFLYFKESRRDRKALSSRGPQWELRCIQTPMFPLNLWREVYSSSSFEWMGPSDRCGQDGGVWLPDAFHSLYEGESRRRETGMRNDRAPPFLGPVKCHRGLDFMGRVPFSLVFTV